MLLALAAATGTAQSGTTAAEAGGATAAPVNERDLAIPEAGVAGGAAGSATPAPRAPAVSTWDFVRMLLVLAAVVGVIYLVFWLLRRGTGRRMTENDLIRVIGSRALSGNRALHLVEVGRSIYLVGASDGGVELIAEITDPESRDAVRVAAAGTGETRRRTFADVLGEIFRPARRGPSLRDGVDFLKRSRDRLKKLRGGP